MAAGKSKLSDSNVDAIAAIVIVFTIVAIAVFWVQGLGG